MEMTDSATPWLDSSGEDMCPCPIDHHRRLEEEENDDGQTWEVVYVCFVLLYMFIALLSDRVGADAVMLTALTLCMAAGIISVSEGLEGFSNEGLVTVMVLFVVAEGISVTGALDWYMGKLLGNPTTTAGAQLRLMIPIAFVSAFLNNTPVVAVMIPIVQRWAKNIRQNAQQLLVPLSFASILGGTCTLIGTSTNLVVVGLLRDRYPDDSSMDIGLFDLGRYGVPIAIAGVTYILIASPFLLPGGKRGSQSNGIVPLNAGDEILLGARLTQWSPAAGRSVKRSGLRDTGGIYLVSVHRAATGNVHRAVGQDFVLNVGDVLYFTGLVEGFGEFCEEHGLEVVTNEVEDTMSVTPPTLAEEDDSGGDHEKNKMVHFEDDLGSSGHGMSRVDDLEPPLSPVAETENEEDDEIPCEVGITKESLMQADEAERIRGINRMTDMIRGVERNEPLDDTTGFTRMSRRKTRAGVSSGVRASDPPKIVVTTDHVDTQRLVIVGINAHDRAGLLLDISKGLLRLDLMLRHTEASVVDERSLSIWRCEYMGDDLPDLEVVWTVLNALLETDTGVQAIKTRGLKVIRAVVTKSSRLVGSTVVETNFRETYKAAIVAVQKGGKSTNKLLSSIRFDTGDVLVLQAGDDSPLLTRPPEDFYRRAQEADAAESSRPGLGQSIAKLVKNRFSNSDLKSMASEVTLDANEIAQAEKPEEDLERGVSIGNRSPARSVESGDREGSEPEGDVEKIEAVWKDLRVIFPEDGNASREFGEREYLTAMEVSPHSKLTNKTAAQAGVSKLPGVFLVSIERPIQQTDESERKNKVRVLNITQDMGASAASSMDGTFMTVEPTFITIDPDEVLQDGDILWFAGSASAVGDLRKIPGLKSYQSEEVEKIEDKVHDRRLVQAVVARKGPLVGKTVKDVRFRTRYGAAVIAVHREGQRIHDHPGRIRLHAGDVLLLEAGPTFIKRSTDHDRSFALLAEVEDSAPPRLRFLIPALIIAAAMLIVFTAGVASLLVCALVAAILMVVLGIMSEQEARDAVNWEIYITIACAFGIGTALTNSGIAGSVAQFLTDVGEAMGIGDAGLFGAVYLATFLISNVVTNNAAAALIFPIALDAAEQSGTDIILMSYCVMLGASASFMSPFGYTTNLLIYGPGGYKYKDFLIIGTPMQIVLWILSVLFLIYDQWWVSWVVTSIVFLIVASVRLTNGAIGGMLCRSRARSNSNAGEEKEHTP